MYALPICLIFSITLLISISWVIFRYGVRIYLEELYEKVYGNANNLFPNKLIFPHKVFLLKYI